MPRPAGLAEGDQLLFLRAHHNLLEDMQTEIQDGHSKLGFKFAAYRLLVDIWRAHRTIIHDKVASRHVRKIDDGEEKDLQNKTAAITRCHNDSSNMSDEKVFYKDGSYIFLNSLEITTALVEIEYNCVSDVPKVSQQTRHGYQDDRDGESKKLKKRQTQ